MSAHPAKVALATSATSIAIVFFIGFSLSRPGGPCAAFVHDRASHA
ncbi:hypothetical protein BURCENBC7_AP6313 [Burkholderia cenocepacia BC7]|nr:uncharacterized protein BCN122_I1118 [Burkholderia cenocepacia]EPZ86425.1 hypothetical protein BURCENK562V_C1911 [Burkholderia cenocepacia K56-2Valvano]ERI29958.1 hypothetical protein BURCENBC7_AP6313 [Burkholderia cenocepacia BC7]